MDYSSKEAGKRFIAATQLHIDGLAPDASQKKPYIEPEGSPSALEGMPRVKLGDVGATDMTVSECIGRRRSHRDFSDSAMPVSTLSYLLWATQGIVKEGKRWFIKTVPSAGARHPIDTYILANKLEGVQPGLYWYDGPSHELVEVDLSADIGARLTEACLGQTFIGESAVSFFWSAVPYRTCWRYGERGYRYLFLDVGHICQNLYLASEAMDCGCCAVAAFDDIPLNKALKIDGEHRLALYAAAVGYRK